MEPETSIRPDGSDAASWAAIAFLAVSVIVFQAAQPLPVTPGSTAKLAITCAALSSVAFWYSRIKPQLQFSLMCVALMQMLLFSAVGIVFSYLVARLGGDFWDDRLALWDRALGFDWLAYLHLVDRSAALTFAYKVAYASLIPQIIVLVCALGFSCRSLQLRMVMFGAILCGSLCIVISGFFPAVSYPAFLHVDATDFMHVNPWVGHAHMADLMALRDGSIGTLDLVKMQGIITFPSYHAGLSTVTLWGFWLTRIRWLQLPGVTLASLTILATPVDGGHYLVDVLAGIAIAVASILAARRAVFWNPALPALTAWPFRRSHAASAR